ncbi:MAG: hypothetical protein WCW54_03975 [Candidatus Paceibacterota bacterium]
MSNKESKSFKLGRDAKTGEFVPVEKAKKNPDRYVVEHVPKAGYGDVPRKNKK